MATKEMKTLKFPSTNQVYEIVDSAGRRQSSLNASAIESKQNKLVSAENIKTVNGQSILGGGDIQIVVTSTMKPTGGDLSTNILAYTENTGIWIGTDNGFWYYWYDADQVYRAGGVYIADATTIINEQIEINRINIVANAAAIENNKKTWDISDVEPDQDDYNVWYKPIV